jgi:hypothetical protein
MTASTAHPTRALTAQAVKHAAAAGKAYRLSDGGGLYLLVSESGTKSWAATFPNEEHRKQWLASPTCAIRRLRHAGTAAHLLDQRPRRDASQERGRTSKRLATELSNADGYGLGCRATRGDGRVCGRGSSRAMPLEPEGGERAALSHDLPSEQRGRTT